MGFQITPGIAKWDGTTWSPIGSGTDAPVLALAASGSKLFVGGSFLNAGRKFSPRLARLDLVASGPAPEIAVSGNGNYFIDGDSSPLLIDHRDFGSAPITGATITRTFAISNQGTGNLTIGAVTIGGIAAGDFSVSLAPVTPVAAGGITIVQVTFDPSVAGTRNATISFSTNDSDEDPFNFSIQGTGTFPEINASGNSTNIVDGDATPSPSDHTEFGTTGVTAGTVARTFTISNSGTADLTIGTIIVGGTQAAEFTVTPPAVSTLAPAGSTTFTVTFDPSDVGSRSASVSFSTNDTDEDPFNFSIQGTGAASIPEIAVSGGGNVIADGSATPDLGNGTYFGSITEASGTVTRIFTIANLGYATLNLGTVTIVGSDFVVAQQPSSSVLPGATTTFRITFDPSAIGTRPASLSCTTNDADENPFNFSISGIGLPLQYPEIAVTGNNANIATGDTSSSPDDHTDFGTCAVTGATVT